MKKITKKYIRGSNYPVYVGNGIASTNLAKVKKFVSPITAEIKKILSL